MRWRRAGLLARWVLVVSLPNTFGGLSVASGQQQSIVPAIDLKREMDDAARRRFTSTADSVDWELARALAVNARGFRLVISLFDRELWAIVGVDTVLTAPVAVASGLMLDYQGKRWSFTTPRGRRTVIAKDSFPVWIPPDWHYYEVAKARGLVVKPLLRGQPVVLDDGRSLEIRSEMVGIAGPDSPFTPLATDEEIIYDGVLYIPPLGTRNRRIDGALGSHRLDLGNGYLLHGTPDVESIGQAATHGCIRLHGHDISWLYEFVPVGTPVYIY